MDALKGYSLTDFLDLARRHRVIENYQIRGECVCLIIEGEEHLLDHTQAWGFVSGVMYDRWRTAALEHESITIDERQGPESP